PLHLAAWNNHADVAEVLIDASADMEQRSCPMHQNTPLGWAIVNGSVAAARLLLERGAAIGDWYLKDARRGQAGEFRAYAHGTPEAYVELEALLRSFGAA